MTKKVNATDRIKMCREFGIPLPWERKGVFFPSTSAAKCKAKAARKNKNPG